jgi:hypothetical protein
VLAGSGKAQAGHPVHSARLALQGRRWRGCNSSTLAPREAEGAQSHVMSVSQQSSAAAQQQPPAARQAFVGRQQATGIQLDLVDLRSQQSAVSSRPAASGQRPVITPPPLGALHATAPALMAPVGPPRTTTAKPR